MKLDYLKEGSADCPLVRLYEFDRSEARRLHQTFERMADGKMERLDLDGVQSVDGTQITLVRSAQDSGVIETSSQRFEVVLSAEGWRQAADLVEPFCDGGFGYQWLTPQTNGIQWLLSKVG